jgi:hypothetical protein
MSLRGTATESLLRGSVGRPCEPLARATRRSLAPGVGAARGHMRGGATVRCCQTRTLGRRSSVRRVNSARPVSMATMPHNTSQDTRPVGARVGARGDSMSQPGAAYGARKDATRETGNTGSGSPAGRSGR